MVFLVALIRILYYFELKSNAMESQNSSLFAGLGIFIFFMFALVIFFVYCSWKLYKKAGKEGWECIIPIYNIIVLLDILKRPRWWILLYLIPFVSLIIAIINCFDLAKAFGKETSFGIGLLLLSPIFFPILALGDSKYMYTDEDGLIREIQKFS